MTVSAAAIRSIDAATTFGRVLNTIYANEMPLANAADGKSKAITLARMRDIYYKAHFFALVGNLKCF